MLANYQNIKVLIVDDTAFMRAGLIKILIEMGFSKDNLVQSEDGLLAINQLQNSKAKFDVILSDWNMPNLNGLELLKHVRSGPESIAKLPFILITTVSEKDKVVEAIAHKVTGYLLKPVSRGPLEENLMQIFSEDNSDE